MKELVVLVILAAGCNDGGKTAKLQLQLEQQQKQVLQLENKLATAARADSLDLDAKCAKQAEAEFHAAGYKDTLFDSFTNHYNPDLRKCFVLFRSTHMVTGSPETLMSANLWDAFERKQYADYAWATDRGKKYWEVKPYLCHVVMPSGETKVCTSTDEFDDLVKTYMGK